MPRHLPATGPVNPSPGSGNVRAERWEEGTPMADASNAGHARRNVFATAAIAALGGLLFGYDTGIIASALLFIKDDFGLSNFEQGMVVSAVPLAAVAGAAMASSLSDRYGRRRM